MFFIKQFTSFRISRLQELMFCTYQSGLTSCAGNISWSSSMFPAPETLSKNLELLWESLFLYFPWFWVSKSKWVVPFSYIGNVWQLWKHFFKIHSFNNIQSNSRLLDNVSGAGNMLPEQEMFPVQKVGPDCLGKCCTISGGSNTVNTCWISRLKSLWPVTFSILVPIYLLIWTNKHKAAI